MSNMKLLMETWNKFLTEEEKTMFVASGEFEKMLADVKGDKLDEGFMQNVESALRGLAKPLALAILLTSVTGVGAKTYQDYQQTQTDVAAQIEDAAERGGASAVQQEYKEHYQTQIDKVKAEMEKYNAEGNFYENELGEFEKAREFFDHASQLQETLYELDARQELLVSPEADQWFSVSFEAPDFSQQTDMGKVSIDFDKTPLKIK